MPQYTVPAYKQRQHKSRLSTSCIALALAAVSLVLVLSIQFSSSHIQTNSSSPHMMNWDDPDQQTTRSNSAEAPTAANVVGKPEVWALGPQKGPQQQQLASQLDAESLSQLKALCGKCLYRTLTSYVRMHDFGRIAVVLTGDIPAMWIRDSAVQMASYFPRIGPRPALRQVLEGSIRAQSYFILQDPWANAYNPAYVAPHTLTKADRQLGRGGWVWTRNFELDSVAYYFNFLWNYHQADGIWSPGVLLQEPLVHDAVTTMLRLLEVEQHHEERSPYRLA